MDTFFLERSLRRNGLQCLLLSALLVINLERARADDQSSPRIDLSAMGTYSVLQKPTPGFPSSQPGFWLSGAYHPWSFLGFGLEGGCLLRKEVLTDIAIGSPGQTTEEDSAYYLGPFIQPEKWWGAFHLYARVGAGLVVDHDRSSASTHYPLNGMPGTETAINDEYLKDLGVPMTIGIDMRVSPWLSLGIGFRDLMILRHELPNTFVDSGTNLEVQDNTLVAHHIFMPFGGVTIALNQADRLQSRTSTPGDRWEAILAGGASIPLGTAVTSAGPYTLSESLGTSSRIEGSLFYQWADVVQVGAEAGYSVSHAIEGNATHTFPDDFTSDSHSHIFSLGPVVRVGPWVEEGGVLLKPYLVAGLNWSHTWTPDGSITFVNSPPQLPSNGFVKGASQDDFGISGGAGIDFKVDTNIVVGGEVRYSRVFSSPLDAQFVVPTAHVAYLF